MMKRSTKRILFTLFFTLALLVLAITWENVFDNHSLSDWVKKFEHRLHQEEQKADEVLSQLKDSVDIEQYKTEGSVIYIGLKNGKLFFWTNEIVGMSGLYETLPGRERFIQVNNSYYELRKRKYNEEIEYFALLHIKDNYPYTNKYIKNHFGKFLKVKAENVDHIEVSPDFLEGGSLIKTVEGEPLFYIKHNENYKDRSVNYILLSVYILFFLCLFYLYGLILRNIASLRCQLLYILLFVAGFILLHVLMYTYRVPDSLYRLRIFDTYSNVCPIVLSVGDLLLTVFATAQILYISFSGIKINYESRRVKRYRYWGLILFFMMILGGILVLTYTIDSLVNNQYIYLNIARVLAIDASSIVAFIAIIIAGLTMVILINGIVNLMKNLIRLKWILINGIVFLLPASLICWMLDYMVLSWGCCAVLLILSLVVLNCHVKRREVQRSIYLLILLLLSVYIVVVERYFEKQRELEQRKEFAMELIEERDYNFEQKLLHIDEQIKRSESVGKLVADYQEEPLRAYLLSDILGMTGYNFRFSLILCKSEDILNIDRENQLYNCNAYFDSLIQTKGIAIDTTHFYLINEFDGQVSYIGKYVMEGVSFVLRFDSEDESEGKGYPQILSRQTIKGANTTYPYSYAKYKNGQLIKSSGFFNYYKSLDRLGEYNQDIFYSVRDNYSHIFIPVDDENVLILSLHNNFFSIYYLNILYVFFICILFSPYGIFFNLNTGANFKRGSLQGRIKNSILLLVISLFVIFTVFSVLFTTKSYERRHYLKAIELLKYLNKELESLACVEYLECPEILETLANWSEILAVDINIYSERGRLVATSRPEIYAAGFVGYLVDPLAYENIIRAKNTSYVDRKKIGDMYYMSAYVPLQLSKDKLYILNVPYFTENDDLNQNIFILVIVIVNIVVVMLVLAFILSGVIAERVTQPLQLLNDKLKKMRIGGKNEKIDYDLKDEVGGLVREYNNMVEKLEDNVKQLARTERESAWREMAKQIAHEIKNPLTPMKLNIQYMQRSLQISDPEEFKEKFKNIANILVEQIDSMAEIASVFSDFAKISESALSRFDVSELLLNTAKLFENNVDKLLYDIEPDVFIWADKMQIQRLFVNVIKNATQSIPDLKPGVVELKLRKREDKVIISVKDNGVGIPEDIREKIFEPNFTTKTKGTGLGLAISKRIVENTGGTIDFVSTSRGTEFIMTLQTDFK